MSLALPDSVRSGTGRLPTGLALVPLLGAALILRLVAIDSRGLWGDEAYRVWAARLPSAFDVLRAAWAQPPSAPLYWSGLHAWIALFGHGDVAVRLFSVPAAVATLGAIFWLGREVAGPAAGAGAAALLALSPLAVETGQEATMYAWTMFLATLALAAGFAWLRTGRGAARYVACGVLLLYTHYMGALLLALTFAAGLLWLARPQAFGGVPPIRPGAWIAAHAGQGLLWTPWLLATGLRLAARWAELSQIRAHAGFPELYGAVLNLSVAAGAVAAWSPRRLALAAGVGGALLAWALVANRAPARRRVWLLAGIGTAFLTTLIGVSALTGAWLGQPRFFVFVLPVALTVLAAGLPAGFAARPWRRLATVLPALLLAGWVVTQVAGLLAFYTAPVHGRDGLREIGAWLVAAARPGDVVLANQPVLLWLVGQYYDGPTQALPANRDVRDGYLLWPPPDQLHLAPAQWAALRRQAAPARRIWLIYLSAMDPDGTLLQEAQARYPPLAVRRYPLADVYLLRGPAP